MLRDLFRLIFDILQRAKYEDTCRGLYIKEKQPKVCGTRIRGKSNDQ